MSRYARRVDGNHGQIREALRMVPGCHVWDSSHAGSGLPDLIVTYRHAMWFLEIKDPTQVPSKRKLSPAEVEFKAFADRALGVAYVVVETVDQALLAMGVTK